MRRFVLALILSVTAILFVGCFAENAQISILGADKDLSDGLLLYPPKVKIENVTPDVIIEAPHLFLENGYDYELVVDIYLERPDKETTDIETGLSYFPAPKDVESWVTTFCQLKIPPNSVASIPITIKIPKNIKAPQRWEFDVKVAETGGGFVQTALVQRWLISMEH